MSCRWKITAIVVTGRGKWDIVFKNGPSKNFERQPLKNLKGYGLLSRPYPFKFFKDCLPQTLLGPFLNILSEIFRSSRN